MITILLRLTTCLYIHPFLQLSVPPYPVTVSKPGAKGGRDYSIGEALTSLKFWQIW